MRLSGISYRAGSELWLRDIDLSLAAGGINVLLGATLAGKTTLLRIMAGLDRPTTGRLVDGDCDLTGIPVRKRNVAMVYQQFINYPSLTVYENIASPLRVARKSEAEIKARVTQLAQTLRLSQFLSRYPAELSGGQQQRTALARALAKDAELLLLDEPLINLDYKLREELRTELTQLFAGGRTTVVYATTEPLEALQLGGHTTLLAAGRVLQSGPTLEVFRRPATLEAARAFSDPPLNVIPATIDSGRSEAVLADGVRLPIAPGLAAALDPQATDIVLGIRAHEFTLSATTGQTALRGRVELAEISGSETFIHLARDDVRLVAQIPGVHDLPLNEPCTLYVRPASLYGFDRGGRLLFAPER
ncbi:MAG: ABC transporter ATP-binding protein [Steroidobacteraceae bacterium]